MTAILGVLLAAGVVLVASPWLWPRDRASGRGPRRSHEIERRAEALLGRAGFAHVAPRVLAVWMGGLALAAAAIAWLVTGAGVLALLAALAAAAAPVLWLRGRVARLLRARRALWPDVCDLLVGSVRAGLSLPDAVSGLAESAPPALRPAFDRFARDMRASGHFGSSIDRLKQVLADPMADRIVETLRMAREVGGTELVGVLRALSVSIRQDTALRAEVESRQSWTRGAAILGVVAPWVILGMLSLRPEGAEAYASPTGVTIIVVGAVVSIASYRAMIRVGRLPEPRRWFA
ncbi:type II secretion system F family protein [Microbacterium indicum]|uniref:type II secretion system F family protein n=1 Tax=Microbacterium indicum TaxID=358100 RepID=UPI00041CEC70|nr:type II secretion system F family protein [Microbacterium indicum]